MKPDLFWYPKDMQIQHFLKKVFIYTGEHNEELLHHLFHIYIKNARRFSKTVLQRKQVDIESFYRYVGEKLEFPFIDSDNLLSQEVDLEIYPYLAMKELACVPLHISSEEVILVSANPFISELVYYLTHQLRDPRDYKVYLAHPAAIFALMDKMFQRIHAGKYTDELRYLFPSESAHIVLTKKQKIFFMITGIVIVLGFIINWYTAMMVTFAALNIMYFIINPVRFWASWKGMMSRASFKVSKKDIASLKEHDLPMYTILIPLYKEAELFSQIIEAVRKLDYPLSKLEVKILLEEDDTETIECARREGLFYAKNSISEHDRSFINQSFGQSIETIIIPRGAVKTKPRACNYGLKKALGEYCVIYDAEDKPEPDQLKKAVFAFKKLGRDTICLQGKLNFYNTTQNLLTRWFTLEYTYWFDYFISGLSQIGAPIPLGGTSNHFRTDWLRLTGGWDAYNVTEDADIGIRLYKRNKRTELINSYTFEEANSELGNWIRQRSRWQKGFVQTYLVHMRRPLKLFRKIGLWKFFQFQIVFGGNFFLVLVNPLLWAVSLFTVPFGIPFTKPLIALCLVNLILGNLIYIAMHVMAAVCSKRYNLIFYAIITPIYWFLISLGAWKGALQLVTKPFYWEKTRHGLYKAGSKK